MARNHGLDTPRESRRTLRGNYDSEAFGRLSERFARFLGTARFLVYMTVFVFSWVLWNVFAPVNLRWDDYPFIFLTLILSPQASYAAPLILLAQNRQADRDRVALNEDRARGDRNMLILNISHANLPAYESHLAKFQRATLSAANLKIYLTRLSKSYASPSLTPSKESWRITKVSITSAIASALGLVGALTITGVP